MNCIYFRKNRLIKRLKHLLTIGSVYIFFQTTGNYFKLFFQSGLYIGEALIFCEHAWFSRSHTASSSQKLTYIGLKRNLKRSKMAQIDFFPPFSLSGSHKISTSPTQQPPPKRSRTYTQNSILAFSSLACPTIRSYSESNEKKLKQNKLFLYSSSNVSQMTRKTQLRNVNEIQNINRPMQLSDLSTTVERNNQNILHTQQYVATQITI